MATTRRRRGPAPRHRGLRPLLLVVSLCAMRGGEGGDAGMMMAFLSPPAAGPTSRANRPTSSSSSSSSVLSVISNCRRTQRRRDPSGGVRVGRGTTTRMPSASRAIESGDADAEAAAVAHDDDDDVKAPSRRSPSIVNSIRSTLRHRTGISISALRSTLRAATGFSLTALRSTLRAATGISLSGVVRDVMRVVLECLTPASRYFLQPFLIAYYVPLMIVRYRLVGPTSTYDEDGRRHHEVIVEGWRRAVEAAERANADGYWPVHLNEDGTITTSLPPDVDDIIDLADGIEMSVAAAAATTETETFATS
ncbi:hypothetical protein ACHAXA_011330 [Cyclostephanos tholiformis]|uniref:Uncharacterized protein n=1 Tax=Cyclostephanos tholiformis TaxID=382380 RepID=A0ABD3RHW4_9STRA